MSAGTASDDDQVTPVIGAGRLASWRSCAYESTPCWFPSSLHDPPVCRNLPFPSTPRAHALGMVRE
jgi:hypothetical protein